MKICGWITLGMLLWSPAVYGFSPYENYLLSGKPTYAGLIARAKEGQDVTLARRLSDLCSTDNSKKFEEAGISNLVVFTRLIQDQTWFAVYFQYAGDKHYLTAAQSFESQTPELLPMIVSHPRAARYGCVWLQMEWINYIRGLQVEREPTEILSMVTTIRPEKESYYRTLHQTVWPGVVDQMIRGSNRNFCIFLVEIDTALYEFFYLEYMGTDAEKDDKLNREDPVNQRWWDQTGPCQQPLAGETEIWVPLRRVMNSTPQQEPVND